MAYCEFCGRAHNVGFVSTRFAGTDGVSLETAKWARIFEKMGFAGYYFAGECDRAPERCYIAPEAHFKHPQVRDIYRNSFGRLIRKRATTQKIYAVKQRLKDQLYAFIKKFDIDTLVPENSLTIPLHIPLGIALTELISETGINTIAHHHDFFWERQHFMTNCVWEYLNMAFPPHLDAIDHVVINSSADNQLSLRTGISGTVIPNVMDFENPPPPPDAYTADVCRDLGIDADTLFILQPTRIVQRKGIEHAIEFVKRLNLKAKLVVSHASGDEGHGYEKRVREYSKMMNVETVFVSDIINEERGQTPDGRNIYTLDDIYPFADMVTYPSDFEGFGNAFLEAVYYRKPILVNTYSIYAMDIKPKGFKVIEIDGYVTRGALQKARKIIRDPDLCREMVAHNYETARQYYSYATLERKLCNLICNRMICRRYNQVNPGRGPERRDPLRA